MKLGAAIRRHTAAIRAMLVFTVILGIAYPLLMTGIAQLAFKDKANGSLIKDASGKVVGSSLLCQQYVDKNGDALAQYFQARPSAASDSSNSSDPGCNYAFSGGSNRGTTDPQLKQTIQGRIDDYAKAYGVDPAKVPEDAVTASGSGMDPGISVANANDQAASVAKARGVDVSVVQKAIKDHTDGRSLGFLGEEYVNVVTLNRDLDKQHPVTAQS
ncbi:potassium-transporting ATPase subunit KdpC [Catenulispora subtropica]|uniref:Potassium-transporting ATPase KdpC subunit n=1 Tax=Catenulispora subtropica TaxID=450798 RepID=A0ABP5C8Z3_9ACTN